MIYRKIAAALTEPQTPTEKVNLGQKYNFQTSVTFMWVGRTTTGAHPAQLMKANHQDLRHLTNYLNFTHLAAHRTKNDPHFPQDAQIR